MKLLRLLPLLIIGLIITSCNNDDTPKENSQYLTISSTLNYVSVIDDSDNSQEIFTGADWGVLVNLDRSTLQLYVNSLQYLPDEHAVSFTLPELRMEYTSTGWKLNNPQSIQVETGVSPLNISDLHVDFVLRNDGSQNLVTIAFTINGRYHVNTLFTHNQFIGSTTSTYITNPDDAPFTTNQSRYLVIIDKKTMKAEVQIANPLFLNGMPTNLGIMRFKDIPMTFTDDGYRFAIANLTPEIGEDPYPAFALTDVNGTVVAGKTMKLNFKCARFNRQVEVNGTAY